MNAPHGISDRDGRYGAASRRLTGGLSATAASATAAPTPTSAHGTPSRSAPPVSTAGGGVRPSWDTGNGSRPRTVSRYARAASSYIDIHAPSRSRYTPMSGRAASVKRCSGGPPSTPIVTVTRYQPVALLGGA